MIDCQLVQEWLPWYISGQLTTSKMQRMASHISACSCCQAELAAIIQLRHRFITSTETPSTPSDAVWDRLAQQLEPAQESRIDVGSFLIGLNVGIAARDRRTPVRGDLSVLGHKVRIIGKRKKGA